MIEMSAIVHILVVCCTCALLKILPRLTGLEFHMENLRLGLPRSRQLQVRSWSSGLARFTCEDK